MRGAPIDRRSRLPYHVSMVVGVATVTLHLAAGTLKDKRRVAKSVAARVHARFNVAVAEVADNDSHTILTFGVACVSTEAGHAHAILDRVVRMIEDERLDAELIDYQIELM
jgi:uncharacterized protein